MLLFVYLYSKQLMEIIKCMPRMQFHYKIEIPAHEITSLTATTFY